MENAYIRVSDTLTNILDSVTKEMVTYSKVTTFVDGSPILDGHCDGVMYRKLNDEYFRRNISAAEVDLNLWGVDITGVSDETAKVNQALAFCALHGYKYLVITGIVKVSARLSDYKNSVLFVGKGEIRSNYKYNNAETQVSNSDSSFSGMINRSGNIGKTINTLAKNKPLKIVVFGDSIAYGRDYQTQSPNDTYFQIVNNETFANSWYANFIKGIQKRFYDKNITIANRAIPGYAISAYNDIVSTLPEVPAWYSSGMAGKTWANILKDESPDLLIIEHGMNSGSEYIKSAIQFIAVVEGWTKVPEIVLMSTPTLNYIDALSVDWAAEPRLSKLDVGNQQYNLSNFKNTYLIDVARIAHIKRYGTDYRNFTFKPKGITDFSFINGAGVIAGGNLGLPDNGRIYVNRYTQSPKFFLSFGFKPDSAFSFFRISTGDSFVIFSSTSVTIYPFTNELGNQLPAATGTVSLTVGSVNNIRIEYGDFLNVYIDNKLIVTSRVSAPVVNILDDIELDISGNSGTSEISSFQYYEAEYTNYRPTLTGTDLWGKLGFGNNGNAINHPTLLGVNETYNIVVNEFLDFLYSKSSNLKDFEFPYIIYDNGIGRYSIEGNGDGFGIVDKTVGAFRFFIKANGCAGFGTFNPTSIMQVVGLGEYADNAAAVTAGLTSGAFYRTGDILKVVH